MQQDPSWKTNIGPDISQFPIFMELTNYFLCLRVHQLLVHPKVGGGECLAVAPFQKN